MTLTCGQASIWAAGVLVADASKSSVADWFSMHGLVILLSTAAYEANAIAISSQIKHITQNVGSVHAYLLVGTDERGIDDCNGIQLQGM